MGWFDLLDDLLTGKKYRELSQTQNEAFIDTLTFVMVVDETLDETERGRLDETLDDMEWEGEVPMARYVEQSLGRARELAPDDYDAYLADVDERLEDQSIREQAYYVSAQIAYADSAGIVESERDLLRRIVEAFEIDGERLELMTDELRKHL